jgi:hypothetical protein
MEKNTICNIGQTKLRLTLGSLLKKSVCQVNDKKSDYISRALEYEISSDEFRLLSKCIATIDVTDNFVEIIDYFHVPLTMTPAGFKIDYQMVGEGVLLIDLIRDISYGENSIKRPTNVLFSADSANPYEIEPIKDLIANLTCNPGIIYDLFINNPKANIGNKFKTRDEVMIEIGRILGPGVDISVELNDPFGCSDEEILAEAEHFRQLLSKYRLVVKVPHTGPVNKDNVQKLLEGDKKLPTSYIDVPTNDGFRGHQIALLLHQHGFRVNFTLMFEPYQANLALQAKPYFINSFIRHRLVQSAEIEKLLGQYEKTKNDEVLESLRAFFIEKDYLPLSENQKSLVEVKKMGENLLKYRHWFDKEGSDGLDGVRHNLRVLKNCNMWDTRLIICSMEGEFNYPDIDKLLSEDEFIDMNDKVVITAEPRYLARFTSSNLVISYQRRFMTAASGQK